MVGWSGYLADGGRDGLGWLGWWRCQVAGVHLARLRVAGLSQGEVLRGRGGAGDFRCRARDRRYGRVSCRRSDVRAAVRRAGAGVRGVRGGAGHPVRLPSAGPARGVVYGAGVRHRHPGGPGPAGVLAGYRGCGCGYPTVEADRPGVRGLPGGVPPPGARQRAGHAVVRGPGHAGAAGGALAAGAGRDAPAHRQRDRARAAPGRAAAGAGVEVRQPAARDRAGLVPGPAGRDGPTRASGW